MRWIKESRFLIFIVIFVLSLFAGPALRNNEAFRSSFPVVYSWLLTGLLSILVAVIIFGLGRLLAGLLVGYRFSSFTVLHLHLYRESGNLSLRWLESKLYKARYLSSVRFIITDFANFRRRMFGFILGGSLATFLLVVISGVSYANRSLLPADSTQITFTMWWQHYLPLGLFLAGLWLLGVSLFPLYKFNDGEKLVLLLRDGQALERYQLLVEVANASAQGIRPREWDIAWINALRAISDDGSNSITARLMLYYWALDRHDVQVMKTALPTAIEPNNKPTKAEHAELAAEATYLELRDPSNAQIVEQLLNKPDKLASHAEPITRMRLACAANLAMHKYAEAQQIAEKVLQLIVYEKAESGTTLMERDLFREMGDKARQAQEAKVK